MGVWWVAASHRTRTSDRYSGSSLLFGFAELLLPFQRATATRGNSLMLNLILQSYGDKTLWKWFLPRQNESRIVSILFLSKIGWKEKKGSQAHDMCLILQTFLEDRHSFVLIRRLRWLWTVGLWGLSPHFLMSGCCASWAAVKVEGFPYTVFTTVY